MPSCTWLFSSWFDKVYTARWVILRLWHRVMEGSAVVAGGMTTTSEFQKIQRTYFFPDGSQSLGPELKGEVHLVSVIPKLVLHHLVLTMTTVTAVRWKTNFETGQFLQSRWKKMDCQEREMTPAQTCMVWHQETMGSCTFWKTNFGEWGQVCDVSSMDTVQSVKILISSATQHC